MSKKNLDLKNDLLAGKQSAIARVLSFVEEDSDLGKAYIEDIFPHTGKSTVIGITGSPGAGKSTLVDQLARHLLSIDKKVAILSVDPSSPYTGGAILGDRIRMTNSLQDKRVFMRSMASRGALGGLAPKTPEMIFVLDAAGFDYILVETVGVGQSEIEIVKTADTVIVVLVPGMGDTVQALKAGILEIADVFALNKADYEGTDRLKKELTTVLGLAENMNWMPEIIKTISTESKGIAELMQAVNKYLVWANSSGEFLKRRTRFLEQTLLRILSDLPRQKILDFCYTNSLYQQGLDLIIKRKKTPNVVAESIWKEYCDHSRRS